jgi:hypothetical protein
MDREEKKGFIGLLEFIEFIGLKGKNIGFEGPRGKNLGPKRKKAE